MGLYRLSYLRSHANPGQTNDRSESIEDVNRFFILYERQTAPIAQWGLGDTQVVGSVKRLFTGVVTEAITT